jgi:hypothetical protein
LKTEHLTRKEIIDTCLKQAGWDVADRSQVIEEFDIVIDSAIAREAATYYAGPTDMIFISGIWKITLLKKFLAFRHATILNDTYISESQEKG